MKKITLFIFYCMTIQSFAAALPQSNAEYCARFGVRQQDQEIIQDLSTEPENLMSFRNDGGIFNGGVCWWHSRFQRNIFYLSLFRPDLEKPKSIQELQLIIHQIRLGSSVVIIPGYANLAEFTTENQKLIQNELNDWQLYDGVVLGGWIDGLKGHSSVAVSEMQKMMSELFDYVSVKKKIAYEKLQIKGITSHAWLVVGIKKMPSGFDIGFIDSNKPQMSQVYSYKIDDQSFFTKSYGNFVPYLEFKREEQRVLDAGKVFCGIKSSFTSDSNAQADYELDLKEAAL
ncbi:MAG: hypothetical protein Q7U04_02800 [Bacteriovorax sp.]|nr:hypothetical protein [Bacteriovorax sp.]